MRIYKAKAPMRIDLGIPGGRQDQYAAAFGGMCVYHFGGKQVLVEPVLSDPAALLELESCLLLGYIGDRRFLQHHLMEDQVRRLTEGDTLRYHDETKAFVDEAVKLLRGMKIAAFGRLLHDAPSLLMFAALGTLAIYNRWREAR